MKKVTTSFVCQECGYDSPKFLGKCPECGIWNSMREIRLQSQNSKFKNQNDNLKFKNLEPRSLSKITADNNKRMNAGFLEVDAVFGGGIVKGSVTLLAGDPGIGKSTLLLQIGLRVASKSQTVLYISAEESEEQVKLRAQRITDLKKETFFLLSTTDTDAIVNVILDKKPDLVIVDSIQTIESEHIDAMSGSVSQIRYSTGQLVKIAKTQNIPIIIVGHVTKDGMVAGPMTLSHMVDTVLFLEGEKTTQTRLLRSLKNRFGPVDEVGVFLMDQEGLKEVKFPEQIFLSKTIEKAPGSVLTVTLEGTRTFLLEIQALCVFSKLPFPRRVASGIDNRRLELLIAVLQKHCRLPLDTMDVFVNAAGGVKITDPAADIAICLAIFSSVKNISLSKTVGISEVGLLGEMRNVSLLEKRVKEAKKLGFTNIIDSKNYKFISNVFKDLEK